jgi:PAS domain S-box-containing protein
MISRMFAMPGTPEARSTVRFPHTPTLDLYPQLVRELPAGVILLLLENPSDAKTFRVVDANPAAAEIFGSAPQVLLGKTLGSLPDLLETQIPDQCLGALRSGKACELKEFPLGSNRGRQGVFSGRAYPLSGNFVGLVLENVATRRRIDQNLWESEERFRLLVQDVQEYAIFQLDSSGCVMSWNSGAERMKGYSSREIVGKHFSVFYSPEDVSSGKPQHNLELAERHGRCEDEGWRTRKDGSRFWANVVITALRDPQGKLYGFAKLTRDMTKERDRLEALETDKMHLQLRVEQRAAVLAQVNHELRSEIAERRRVEEQLRASLDQLRALAARLQSVREEERKHVAREIHDELGQACTAIKMDLALIGHRITPRQTKLRGKINSALGLVNDMIFTLRRIASELRPRPLDDLGLPAALEWQAQEFENRTGIQCALVLAEDVPSLDPEQSTAIFRIFQECLTNVARHAEATKVEACLKTTGSHLVFQVSDNGKGFDHEEARRRGSLGLLGMQERALLVNGSLAVEGGPGVGTTMTLRIPLPPLKPGINIRNEVSDR